MMSLRIVLISFLSFLMCVFTACTEPGETTAVGAATGGLIGAGLGAIVGNQTGDPGAGLVIGGMAGAGAGAAVGNALEAQQQEIRAQDEALERQQQTLKAQRSELEEFRRTQGESVPYNYDYNAKSRGKPSPAMPRAGKLQPTPKSRDSISGSYKDYYTEQKPAPIVKKSDDILQEKSITPSREQATSSTVPVVQKSVDVVKQSDVRPIEEYQKPKVEEASSRAPSIAAASQCANGDAEIAKAKEASDNADKLFYLRRALRLCPGVPAYHVALADLYIKLNRIEDAKFELNEALKIDSNFAPAKEKLSGL